MRTISMMQARIYIRNVLTQAASIAARSTFMRIREECLHAYILYESG